MEALRRTAIPPPPLCVSRSASRSAHRFPRARKYAARIARLQREFDHVAHTPPPKCGAEGWPEELLRYWYKSGGSITVELATRLFEHLGKAHLHLVGAGFPRVELDPTVNVAGGLLGASERGERQPFDAIGLQLANRGFALVDLGGSASADFYARACDEGRRLWPRMKAGELTNKDGRLTAGKDPSGEQRGDRYIVCSEAREEGAWPALAACEAALTLIGAEVNTSLRHVLKLRSDPYFACFPGGGARYGAHFDGGGFNPLCKLTTILYTNDGWAEADGGALEIYDEQQRCWHTVQPHAGRVVFFRADAVLHRVAPCSAARYALTAWWYASEAPLPQLTVAGDVLLAHNCPRPHTETYNRRSAEGERAARALRAAMR
jgi:hypothetical protein